MAVRMGWSNSITHRPRAHECNKFPLRRERPYATESTLGFIFTRIDSPSLSIFLPFLFSCERGSGNIYRRRRLQGGLDDLPNSEDYTYPISAITSKIAAR